MVKTVEEHLESIRKGCEAVEEQYVKLPIGADGRYIVPGDTVYGEDRKRWVVHGIGVGPNPVIARSPETKEYRELRPKRLTHEEPDTWAKLYDDVMWSESSMTKVGLAQFKERALALADEEPKY